MRMTVKLDSTMYSTDAALIEVIQQAFLEAEGRLKQCATLTIGGLTIPFRFDDDILTQYSKGQGKIVILEMLSIRK